MTVFGIDIDFVNLRADEIYTQDSRIPLTTNRFGTPLQDAMRRDFTVNSLFYNLRTHKIEDYTNLGIKHLLVDKMIQTPIDPKITFYDDPLRVLRAIRFAVRYNFHLHSDVRKAAMSQPVQDALHKKVSRERIGKELEGMLTGKNAKPIRALFMIADLQLSQSVFSFPTVDKNWDIQPNQTPEMIQMKWNESSKCLTILSKVLPSFQQMMKTTYIHDKKDSSITLNLRLLYLSTFFLPYRSVKVLYKQTKELSIAQWILKEGIKFKNFDVSTIGNHFQNISETQQLLQKHFKHFTTNNDQCEKIVSSNEDDVEKDMAIDDNFKNNDRIKNLPSRLEAGLILRKLKDEWLTNLVLSTVLELYEMSNDSTSALIDDQPQETLSSSRVQQIVHVLYDLYCCINNELKLDQCWKIRPLLDGKQVLQCLSLPKGPLVGIYLEEQIRYMLLHPNATKQQCETHLKAIHRKRQLEGSDEFFLAQITESKMGAKRKK